MNMFVILNSYLAEMFESPDIHSFGVSLWDRVTSEVYKRKVDTSDKLLARMKGACCRHKEHATRDLRTLLAKCTDVDGGIFEYLL